MKHTYPLPGLVILTCLVVNTLHAQSTPSAPVAAPSSLPPAASAYTPPATNAVVLPEPLHDPIEPVNRAIWGFNKGLMKSVIKPASKGYRTVVPKPVRLGIGNVGRNLTTPVRLLNELLQGDWQELHDETKRLCYNTIFGLGGLFDIATKSNIPKPDNGFGKTLQKWGCQPGIFLMLPILGPSDVRDGSGLVGDYAANPLTYFYPFYYIGSGVAANNFSDTVDGAVRFSEAEADSYSILQYAWTFSHVNQKPDMTLNGSQDQATLQTLHSFFFSYKDPEFLSRSRTRSVVMPNTGKKLDFTYWLQPHPAPLVYIIPGFGAHRLAGNVLGLAELLVAHGYSVVTVSSTFHIEFMENASSTKLPAYPPLGIHDLHVALTLIDQQLDAKYPQRLGARAIMGYSMGAFQSLYLAANEATNTAPLLKFQRYVAIDSPVHLHYAVTNLDAYFQAPMAWPAAEREKNIENMFLKVAALVGRPGVQDAPLPLNEIESKFLIGLSFRLTLRDILFDSQFRNNMGVLKTPLDKSRRRAAYDEILKYSFQNYIDDFAAPYDLTLGIDIKDPNVVKWGIDLDSYTPGLQANPKIRVILNRNDLLVTPADIAWIESTFAPSVITEFPDGGHVGNLAKPEVQQAILRDLDGLGAAGN